MCQGGVISGIGEDASSGGVGARQLRLGAIVYTRLRRFRWGDFRHAGNRSNYRWVEKNDQTTSRPPGRPASKICASQNAQTLMKQNGKIQNRRVGIQRIEKRSNANKTEWKSPKNHQNFGNLLNTRLKNLGLRCAVRWVCAGKTRDAPEALWICAGAFFR